MSYRAPAGAYGGNLPTVSEVHAFVNTINDGRHALGLLPIGTLSMIEEFPDDYAELRFDDCSPGAPDACLSATHLAHPAGYRVSSESFYPAIDYGSEQRSDAMSRVGEQGSRESDQFIIPEAIRKVTDPFDYGLEGLREVFVEAGYVEVM